MHMEKPKIELAGQDDNVFAILGRASRALKQAGMADEAKEMFDRVTSCGDYYDALNIVSEYVETELSSKGHGSKPRGTER